MLDNLEVLCHSSIRITGEKTIYIDPYEIKEEYHDADVIFCTHAHYDHFSPQDILKVKKDDSYIVIVEDNITDALKLGFKQHEIAIVKPNYRFYVNGVDFVTTPAYNKNKPFHPKDNEWVGYAITLNNTVYYIAGDTDHIPELDNVRCDVALLPVAGTYTMDYFEAAELANRIMPKFAIPTHYGSIVGIESDPVNFVKHLHRDIVGKILMK